MNFLKLATISSMAAMAFAALAQGDLGAIHVLVFGNPVQFENQQPVMSNGRVLVPLRGVFWRMGAQVDWDPQTQTVTAKRGRTTVRLTIGELDATVNDRIVHLDVPATLMNGSTMVPLRFVSEAFGADVHWNEAEQEVAITRGADFVQDQTPQRVVVRPRTHYTPPQVYVIPADSVLPLRLDNRLDSYDAHRGDPFSATLDTGPNNTYAGLPAGTKVYGRVGLVTPRRGDTPGMIELEFDHMSTPGGSNFPINGRLIGLDDRSIHQNNSGNFVANDTVRNERVFFTGSAPGAGVILGFHNGHAIADIQIGDMVKRTMARGVTHRDAHDVELVPGTRMGFRLYQNLTFQKNVR